MSYYSPTGNPGTAAAGLSAAMRAEFAAIAAGFALLPNYSGNANKFVVVNSSGTGLTATASPAFGSLPSLHVTGTASFDNSMHVNGIQSQDASPVGLLGGARVSLGDLAVAPSGNNSGSLIVSVSDDGNPTGLAQGTLYGRFASLHGTGVGWNLYQPDSGAAIFNYRQSLPAWWSRMNPGTGVLEWSSAPAGAGDTAATLTLRHSFAPNGDLTSTGNVTAAAIKVGSNQVVGARNTGYTPMTGAGDAGTAFDTTTVTLAQLASRVKALQASLTTHGLVGT
jgi:hypothetical protein